MKQLVLIEWLENIVRNNKIKTHADFLVCVFIFTCIDLFLVFISYFYKII